jgi:hypothetical protein
VSVAAGRRLTAERPHWAKILKNSARLFVAFAFASHSLCPLPVRKGTKLSLVNMTMEDNKAPQGERPLSKVPPPQSTEERVRLWELSLFQEAAESTLASASIFAVADMRALAHNNLISKEQAEEVLKLPMNGHRLRKLQEKHEGLGKNFKSHDFMENAEKYMKTHNMPGPVVGRLLISWFLIVRLVIS